MRKKQRSEQADRKALAAIEGAGWKLVGVREGGVGRFVATRQIAEKEDDSVTKRFESDYTLQGLAANVERREREDGRKA